MPPSMHPVDIAVLVVYVMGVVGFGAWFVRKSSHTEEFMAAGRSLPGWVVGLSILGTYVSSISFLANPGKSYAENWNRFIFGLSLPIAALIATRFFVPFYRKSGEISAYTHMEHRFGAWARTYLVVCFLLVQLVRMGAIMLLVSIALEKLTGWDQRQIIIATAVLVTLYTLLGGIEAVIWTDVVQTIVLCIGMAVCVGLILFRMPEGPGQIFEIAYENSKFSLGSFDFEFVTTTFWVVLLYGIAENLKNFGIDQAYVQRYITAKNESAARSSVWIGALLYIPISAVLFFIGTALFTFYSAQPELLPESVRQNGDEVFPYFIVHELPVGMTGLLIAAIFAAAMSSVDSSLNSSATLILRDVYKRYFRPNAGERESMVVLYTATLAWGLLATLIALALIGVDSVLDAWWNISGIIAGGMLGLFLLGLVSKRAGNTAAATGVIVGLLVISWLTLLSLTQETIAGLQGPFPAFYDKLLTLVDIMGPYRERWQIHSLLILVIGTVTILVVGLVVSRFTPPPGESPSATGEH